MKNEYNDKKGISYPERFMIAYLEVKGIEYEYQKKLNNSKRRFDFYIPSLNTVIETHGLQHYEEVNLYDHKRTVESDQFKRKYCKENNITLIELDCSRSEFNFIKNNIKENTTLPNIKKNEEKEIMRIAEEYSYYDVEEMLRLYNEEGLTFLDIGVKLNIKETTVGMVLKRNGVESIEITQNKVEGNEEEICRLYEDGMSIVDIDKKFNLKNSLKVDKILKDNYVELRPGGRRA